MAYLDSQGDPSPFKKFDPWDPPLTEPPASLQDMALNDGRPPDAAVGGGEWRSNQATKTSQGLPPGGKGET